MKVKVVDSFNVPASTVTVLFQQKQANHENVAISKLSQINFVITNNDNWLLTAIIYLWISELLLLNSEFLLACFCPVFSWSDNQGWLTGWGVWRSARIYDSSVLSRFCFDAAMKSIGRPGKSSEETRSIEGGSHTHTVTVWCMSYTWLYYTLLCHTSVTYKTIHTPTASYRVFSNTHTLQGPVMWSAIDQRRSTIHCNLPTYWWQQALIRWEGSCLQTHGWLHTRPNARFPKLTHSLLGSLYRL